MTSYCGGCVRDACIVVGGARALRLKESFALPKGVNAHTHNSTFVRNNSPSKERELSRLSPCTSAAP